MKKDLKMAEHQNSRTEEIKVKKQKVFSVDLAMVLKYQGFNKNVANGLVNALLEHNSKSDFYKKAKEVNPFELVRIEYVKSVPMLYTLASSAEVANGRFMEVLVPVINVRKPDFYDQDILESMLDFNTKEDSHITWVPEAEYNKEVEYSFHFKPEIGDDIEEDEVTTD